MIDIHGAITSTSFTAMNLTGGGRNTINIADGARINSSSITLNTEGHFNVIENDGRLVSERANAISFTGNINTLTNNGIIEGRTNAVFISGTSNEVRNGGFMDAGLSTVLLNGHDNHFLNTGTVEGDDVGVRAVGTFGSMRNEGTVRGTLGAVEVDGATQFELINTGTLASAGGVTVKLDGGGSLVTLNNSGTIEAATSAGIVIVGGDGSEEIDNSGTIRGVANLGAGRDIFRNLGGGVVFGSIDGEGGNDALIGNGTAEVFYGGNGTDELLLGSGHDKGFGEGD
ncbi:MAG: hypothetical protein AAF615_09800, partial [Pseudomonadota bacterium]